MNIVKIANHACVRVQKMALPLRSKGHKVHLIAHSVPTFFEDYSSFNLCVSIDQMIEAVKLHKDADAFHVHNEPSYFVTLVKEIFPDKPVIIDVHDSFLGRITKEAWQERVDKGDMPIRYVAEEKYNFQLADGLVFPSESLSDMVKFEYELGQPSIVMYPYVPSKLYRYTMREYLGGLVYEGRVQIDAEIEKGSSMEGFTYCAYEELARQCKELDIPLHLHTIRNEPEFFRAFSETAIIHKALNVSELLKVLSRYDWGLVGNVYPTSQWDVAMPNKMFEYIAAGIPVVAINARECENFVVENDIGISVKSISELADRWGECREKRNNVLKKRQQFSMDAHIHRLENLYQEVINA